MKVLPSSRKIFRWRIVKRVGLSLAAILVILPFACLDTVDYHPYLRETYFKDTTARLRTQQTTNHIVRGELSAGFGRARLTPTVNSAVDDPVHGQFRSLPLAGYGNRNGKSATGIHDDLFVKAVAIRVGDRIGVMIGADALIIPPEVTDAAMARIVPELKLSREQIYLSATHTHCSLGGWGEGWVGEAFAGGFQAGSRIWFADCIVTAVREALNDLKIATLGHGQFTATQYVRNRVVGELGTIDPEFSFLVLQQQGGKTGIVGSFSAHATVLSGRMMEFSADYPGAWQRAVESATGGTAVFLAGGVGSHAPLPGESGIEGVEKMGQSLARMLLEKLPKTSLTNSITFGMLGLEVTLPQPNVRVTDALRLRPWLARTLVPLKTHTYLQAFRIDDEIWISTPCDFSGELAQGIKQFIRPRGANAVITSFNGDYIGYVICPKYYHLDGYEPRLMSFFGPYVPEYLDGLIRSITVQLSSN